MDRSQRRRQIEHDLDPTGSVRRLVYDGSGAFTVEEWNAYVDWILAQQEQQPLLRPPSTGENT
jgi:hypothetical protein